MNGWRNSAVRKDFLHLMFIKIRNSDAFSQTIINRFFHFLPSVYEINVRIQWDSLIICWKQWVPFLQGEWPMNEIQVEIWSLQIFKGCFKSSSHQIRSKKRTPNFACDEHLFPNLRNALWYQIAEDWNILYLLTTPSLIFASSPSPTSCSFSYTWAQSILR